MSIMVLSGGSFIPDQDYMLTTNQILHKGRYRIINSFSHDETGGLYEAYDTVSNTNVALRESVGNLGKVTTSTQLEAMNSAFAGGAKVLTEIKHESLVSVQDYFSEIGRQYLVLEAVTGSDLSKFLGPNEGRPILTDVLAWANQLLGALNYLHKFAPPVIHRDITPENIKLTSNHRVKLLTAEIAANPASGHSSHSPGRAIENKVLHYRPLEHLWEGLDPTSQRVLLQDYDERSAGLLMQPLDARSDLYSLAASLYHVLTGTLPYDALERSISILDGKPDPLKTPASLDASIPPEISDVFVKAMAIRRENRFDSALLMQQVLRTAIIRVEERRSEGPEAAVEVRSESSVGKEIASAEARQLELKTEESRLEKECELIEQRRHEPVEDCDDEPLLLELEPAGPVLRTSDNAFELLKDELVDEVQVENESMSARSYKSLDDLVIGREEKRSGFRLTVPVVAGLAVLLALAVIGFWQFSSFADTKPAGTSGQITVQADQIQQPVLDERSIPEQPAVSEASATTLPSSSAPTQISAKAKPAQLNTDQEKAKKAAPAKTPPPKKKLTVDDLIHDN